jgi:hypothetical protein
VTKVGKRLTITFAVLAVLCVAPISLYGVFGPEDGNPLGLGLLMVFGTPVFTIAAVIAAIIWVSGFIRTSSKRK